MFLTTIFFMKQFNKILHLFRMNLSNFVKKNMDTPENISFNNFKEEVLNDFKLANLSRQLSLLGRKEVLSGKAKFGIFGDGKEIAQIAMAKQFKNGDWRSGYYRDQTFMLAIGGLTPVEFFSQLYGDINIENNPSNGGRSFNNHWGTRFIDENGNWKDITKSKNTSADISPTAGQMPRLLGLAWASKLFRENPELHQFSTLSNNGNEVAFGTIGDASTSEGHFWETLNAAGVLQVPLAISVWDDGFGISVPRSLQTIKDNISEALKGFENTDKKKGFYIYKAKGWDYAGLIKMYKDGIEKCRTEHTPVIFHISDLTQPQGHSTSGSHERYKTEERLNFEAEFDAIAKFYDWILEKNIASNSELDKIVESSKIEAREAKKIAWEKYISPILKEKDSLINIVKSRSCKCVLQEEADQVDIIANNLSKILNPTRKDVFSSAKKIIRNVCSGCGSKHTLHIQLKNWLSENYDTVANQYHKYLYVEDETSALKVVPIAPIFDENKTVAGREILRDNFNILFQKNPKILTFGEDTGKIGGVNQSMEGMQEKYGELRVSDTGIRETTILGQGIGVALRGLRPLVEIQYFDYLMYALQTLSDDLATTHWRTAGGQKAPVIITTRGHRLEGIWHSGSPLSMVINSIRGVYVCVPRNMTQAAGFYNTLFQADDSALVIEPLNGYRLHEKYPKNIGEYRIPLGVPEILETGTDITLVTYGSCVRIAQDAVEQLKKFNISVELIDVQTLLPFDTNKIILESVKKTGKILFFDEDVPGGATAYMMQKVIEEQEAYYYLDSQPRTLSAQEHRPAYATDGDYFSNPNAENVFESIYQIMHNNNPKKFPALY